jgi:Proteasome non-ATPase 26S subunit
VCSLVRNMDALDGTANEPTLDSLLMILAVRETTLQESIQKRTTPKDHQHIIESLEKHFAPHDVMKRITTFLLSMKSDNEENKLVLSPDIALQILVHLASANPDRYVKSASLAVRGEALRLETSTDNMVIPEGLLPILGEQLRSSDTQVAQNSIDTLVSLFKSCSGRMEDIVGLAYTQLQDSRSKLTIQRKDASVVCVRCLTTLVDVACISSASMALIEPCLVDLLDLLQDDSDPLLQISALDLIQKLAETEPVHRERATWLYQHASYIVKLAGGDVDLPPDPMLGSFALRTVATLCGLMRSHSLHDNELTQSFLSALHNNIRTGAMDRMTFVVAISAFAASSDDALRQVLQDEEARQAWLNLSVAQPKLKAAILLSVSGVIETTKLSRESTMKLYTFLGHGNGPDATEVLLKLVLSPMSEVRIAAYTVFRSVAASLPTGSQVLLSHNGFLEMLMDRQTETSKSGREARYEVVNAVLDSPVVSLLAEGIVKRLETYRHAGPHYVEPLQWDVMEQ